MGGPTRRESQGPGVLVVPKAECCNSMTQTDRNVCRWLADQPREGARDAQRPQPTWSSSKRGLEVVTGERLEIERLTSRSEEGRWKSTHRGNSLAAYPTARPVLKGGREETCRKV